MPEQASGRQNIDNTNLSGVTPDIKTRIFIIARESDVKPVGPSRSREVVLAEGKEKAADFQTRLEKFLDQEGLRSETGKINNMTHIPATIIECTPRVAERLKELKGVKGVMEDQHVEPIRPVKPKRPV